MARINLLPWREELRQERQRQFLISAMATAVLAVVLLFLVGMIFDQQIRHQQTRNQLIQGEIGRLQARIDRINQLEQTRERLLSRKRIIEDLQSSRSLTVQLFDQLAKSIPVGVSLDTIAQQAEAVTLTGASQSNARVSAYLQSLQANELFIDPELVIVEEDATPENTVEPYDFSIKVKLKKTATESDTDGYDDETTGAGAN